MARLLILFDLPAPLAPEPAEAWLRDAVASLSAHPDVERAVLSHLAPGSRRHPRNWQRLLELELADGADAACWADEGRCGEWLADLRSLRLSPTILRAETRAVLRG